MAEANRAYEEARNEGRDLLAEMVARVDSEIPNERKRLEEIMQEGTNR